MTIPITNTAQTLLMQAHSGELYAETFFRQLMEVQVFMPIYEKHQIGGLPPTTCNQAIPLILQDEAGHTRLILFTNPERPNSLCAIIPATVAVY